MSVNYIFRAFEEWDLVCALHQEYPDLSKHECKRRLDLGVFPTWLINKTVDDYGLCRKQAHHNLVPTGIREYLATLISGTDVVPTFKANKVALGTDATPVSVSDTELGNETVRQDFSDRNSVGTQAFLNKFFGSIDVGGQTFQEAGVWVDGAASVGGAGYLLSHVNFNETLTSTESLTINAVISINNG